ncbi:MAG: eL32 family ribosomal protein [Nanoarchaeota archaeon]|nr:eL32 family ribosomal protein [Nanoarchaeota archaeon]MBU4086570.1 eL32 family ribosomal protein [Nanoarchaeota archaeon]
MARKKFIRRNHDKYKRLGGRRKKLIWRRPKGIHNKMRERRAGYPQRPEIGMKNYQDETKLVRNMKDLMMIKKGEKVILAKVGRKLRSLMETKANEIGAKILNQRKSGENKK